jgi:RimJ/RimL family protein N-acetyltransferase
MQKSWREDGDKLTFILCLPVGSSQSESREIEGGDVSRNEGHRNIVKANIDDAFERMIGDINLFLYPFLSDDDDDDDASTDLIGEIELMIARRDLHRQGYGRAALLAFIDYILVQWEEIGRACSEHDDAAAEAGDKQSSRIRSDVPATAESAGEGRRLIYLRVKINASNEGSIRLFESVGFVPTAAGANYFGEVELRWEIGGHERSNSGKHNGGDGGGGGGSAEDLKTAAERWRKTKGWEEVEVKRYA